MAFGTIRGFALDHELFAMVVSVTIGTAANIEFFGISGFVAACALYLLVLPLQGILSKGVVEIRHSLDLVKGFLRMAFGAILPEFVVMDIPVATGTFPERETGKLLHRFPVALGYFVALRTIHSCMFAPQSELCPFVVEF